MSTPNTELMVSPRNFTLVTPHPWMFKVRANVPIEIPSPMVKDAIAAGMRLVEEDKTEEALVPTHDDPEPRNAEKRQELLLATIKKVRDRNDPKEFTAAGVPSAKAISMIVRFTVSQREITALYTALRDKEMAEAQQRAFDRAAEMDVPKFVLASTEAGDK